MERKSYKYHVQVDMVHDKENKECPSTPIEFDFENHDNLFRIIDFLRESPHFENEQEIKKFAVGLKLFGGVMIKDKDSELFRDFFPAFVEFMKKLKGK